MSGPKTSVLSPNFLTYKGLSDSAKATWAEKELLISLLAMQTCEKEIATLIEQIQLLQGSDTDERIQACIESAKATLDVRFDDIDESHDFTSQELSLMRTQGAPNVSTTVNVNAQALEGKYLEYFQSVRGKSVAQLTAIARSCAAKAANMKTQVRRLTLVREDLEAAIKEEVFRDGIRTSFYIPFANLHNRVGAEKIIEKINDALRGVSSLILSDALLEQLHSLKAKASEITDASYLSNFYQLVICPFVDACTQYDGFYNAHFAEFEEYKTTYEILCSELGLVPQQMAFSAEAITFYQAQTVVLQEILINRHARELVMKTVNEVMAEMGYDMVASRDVTKKNGKQYHDELYIYGEGTAISVVHSSDGQLTMEIGGLDYGDRAPTEEEAKNMSAQMQTFCVDYATIAEELKKRGLDVRTVTMLPPDAQYATIINLEDYEVTGSVKTIQEVDKEEEQATKTDKKKHAED